MSEKTFDEKLTELLKTDNDFVDNDTGELLRERIKRRAYDLDKDLITLLLSDDTIATAFFEEIAGRWIFNNKKFVAYLKDTNFLNKSYTKFKKNIRLTIDDKTLQERGEVALVWPCKDCVLEGGQTEEQHGQDEIFFNEILAPDEINQMFKPKVLTNWKHHTPNGEQDVTEIQRDENDTIRDNLIIKGNNLIALHTLKKQFYEKIKVIYIDPPYNTGKDSFGYNDKFNHSSWLTFMRNRLKVASELLTDDGVIFASCDDNEQAYLKVVMDEIFGDENFVANFVVIRAEGGGLAKQVVKGHDYLLTYAKKIKNFEPLRKPKDVRGKIVEKDGEKYWIEEDWLREEFGKYGTCYYEDIERIKGKAKKDEIDKGIEDGQYILLKKEKNKTVVGRYRALEQDGSKFYSILKHLNADGKNELKDLMGEDTFAFPKPTSLLKEIILGATFFKKDKDAIILDFFAGSGTTGQAVLQLNNQDGGNRRFILVEQLEEHIAVCKRRLEKVIVQEDIADGHFLSCELKAYNEAFMERIQSAECTEQLLEIWREMPRNAILKWYINPKAPEKAEEEFIKIDDLDKQKQELADQLEKNQLYVNLSEIADETYEVSESDKQLNKDFYSNKGNDE